MPNEDSRIVARISRFVTQRVQPQVYLTSAPLTVAAWAAPGEPVLFDEASRQNYAGVEPGFRWGRAWSTTWFHVTGTVPPEWAQPDTAVEVVVDLGFSDDSTGFQAEGLAWTPGGDVVKSIQPRNQYVPVGVGPVDFYLEAGANPVIMGAAPSPFRPTPLGTRETAGDAPLYTLRCADVRLRSVPTWELLQDFRVLLGLVGQLPASSTRRATIIQALTASLDVIDPADVHGTADAARAVLAPVLSAPTAACAHQVYATGHAHIDSAWLWPLRETVRKCARTFANQLALMDNNHDYVFACSTAQHYAWIKQGYPSLYARVKKKVAAGQFVPVGSMWVESDTNLTGGEAFARQLVMGKRFFLDEFGVETREVWLPDTFGYSGALPQLAKLAGCDWFLSQKLSWNDTDTMPHHTFWWEGIDGSRVFVHFPPVDTYNSNLSPAELAHAEANFADKGRANRSLVPFGWGDGGGGPTREMLAAAKRTSNLEGLPAVRLASPAQFFTDAAAEYPDAPTWVGEMYLEFHRGTYTSQARTKAGNRRSEHLLREAELWAATASVQCGAEYPYDELDRLWKLVLLHQFHDILPGSSIGWVHREAEQTYAEVASAAEAVIATAAAQVVGDGNQPMLLNAAPHARDGVPALAAGPVQPPTGANVLVTPGPDGTVTLNNGLVRVTIAADGTFASLLDVTGGREVLPADVHGNVVRVHRDMPGAWDAWDLDREYRRVVTEVPADAPPTVVSTPDEACVTISRQFGDSHVTQRVTLRRGSAAIEIVNDIDWHEREKLLKLVFPLDVQADRAAFETQFGHVWRPTHANTSWDAAKYEVCAHRWVYIGEPGYGVGIANSATYGHNVTHMTRPDGAPYTTVGLSLLRAPLFPDPTADEGHHTRTVVIHPGATLAQTITDGYRANLAPRVVTGTHPAEPLIDVSNPAVVVEAVKLADDRSGDVIVRLYESLGGRATTTVTATFDAQAISRVDLLERPQGGAADTLDHNQITLNLHPFEVVTLRIKG